MRVFVDDAGPRSVAPAKGQELRGNVTCAAAVPALLEDAVLDVLPRSPSTGELLKAQGSELSPEQAERTVEALLRIDGLDIAVLVADVGDNNLEVFRKAQFASSIVRQALGERQISGPNLLYITFVTHVVASVWGVARRRHEHRSSYLDLILDDANLQHGETQLFRRVVTAAAEECQIRYRKITWDNETAEPLLHVPDLIAGIYHRGLNCDDVRGCVKLLESAKRTGRVRVNQGLEVKIPSPDEAKKTADEIRRSR